MSKEIAEALMVEAKSDLDAAKLLLEGGIYSRSIYHSQQAVEKAEYVFNAILEFLKDKYKIEFEVGEEQK